MASSKMIALQRTLRPVVRTFTSTAMRSSSINTTVDDKSNYKLTRQPSEVGCVIVIDAFVWDEK